MYCPDLVLDDLQPEEAGIRAQAVMVDGTLVHDFLIEETDPPCTSATPRRRRRL